MTSERTVVHENKTLGIRVEGRYRRADWGNAWILTHWRVRHKHGAEFGEWHRVHGNQRKDCAGLKLILEG